VDPLGEAKEVGAATGHQPACLDTETAGVGQQAVKHLGHTAARRRAVDVPDRPAAQLGPNLFRVSPGFLDDLGPQDTGERLR
jgi:hypothetical protein